MKKVNLLGVILLCSIGLFGCGNDIEEHVMVDKTENSRQIPIYTLTFDYTVSIDEAVKYAKDFGKEITKNGLDDFNIKIKTDYGEELLLYEDGKLGLNTYEY